MADRLLHIVDSYYALEELSVGEMTSFKTCGMHFFTEAYDAKDLGRVTVFRGQGIFGLLKREVVIITPVEVDLPLYTYDRIRFSGIDKLIVEMYNTIVSDYSSKEMHRVKRDYSALKERGSFRPFFDSMRLPSSFRKKSWALRTPSFDKMTLDHFAAYLSSAQEKLPDTKEKKEKISFFVKGLYGTGGALVGAFTRKYGKEKGYDIFSEYVFGLKERKGEK